jgi:hypothetical protein
VPLALAHVLVLELISGILCIVGCIELLVNNGRVVLWRSIFLYNFTYVAFWSTISKRLRWSKNCCYLLHTGSNGRLLVELEYINKQKNNYIDI